MDESQPVPDLPQYGTSKTFAHPKQQGIFNKVLGRMLAPKIRQKHGQVTSQNVKIKHKKIRYW